MFNDSGFLDMNDFVFNEGLEDLYENNNIDEYESHK